MSRTPIEKATKQIAKRRLKCHGCEVVIEKDMEYIKWGSRKYCHDCFEAEAFKVREKLQQKEKKKVEEVVTIEGSKPICPRCHAEENLPIIDYGLARDKSKGTFFFIHQCQDCHQKFIVQKDI
ncbi:hypothetical protein [Neomoorella thermoacetica]|nr:hypothetical protein [Moorella thermoacetica]